MNIAGKGKLIEGDLIDTGNYKTKIYEGKIKI